MNTIVQSPDFIASKTLLDFVQANANKLESFTDRISECRVCLKMDKSDVNQNKICEIKLFVPHGNFFASKASHSFEDATTKTIEAIKHQLTRRKDSKTHKVNTSAFSAYHET